MKTWKHMNIDTRKIIASCISHNKKLIEICNIVGYDTRAISKEIKINRKQISILKALKFVLNLQDSHRYVLITKTDITIVHLQNMFTIQTLHRK